MPPLFAPLPERPEIMPFPPPLVGSSHPSGFSREILLACKMKPKHQLSLSPWGLWTRCSGIVYIKLRVAWSWVELFWIHENHKKHSISKASPLTASASQQNQYHRMPKPNTTASKASQGLQSSLATLTPVALSLLSLLLWECFHYFPLLVLCFAAWRVQSNKWVHSSSCRSLRLNLAPNPNISMKPAQGPYPSERTCNFADRRETYFRQVSIMLSHCE